MNPFPGEFSADDGLSRAEIRAKKRRRMMRRRRTTTIIVICVLIFGIGGFFGVRAAGGVFDDLFGPKGDYEGQGTNEVSIEIAPGSSARTVANQLVEEGVVMNSEPFLDEIERRDATIQAGTWTMREKMSSKAAVEALINPIAPPKITVAEGKQVEEIKAIMIESGMNADEVDKAIDDKTPKDYGLEIDAPSLEGYLYPATYDMKKSKTAEDVVQEMVDKTETELDELGIEHKDANRVLTLASLVEKESPGDEEVRKKVARVFLNRISEKSQTGGLLQSDATVAYIHGARSDLTTTKKERQSDSPYNTYKKKGLPPGPINAPSQGAVEAALEPADGDWQFFVATNPDTGETKFAKTYEEHQKNVEIYRKWLKEHNSDGGKE
ncbi:endolytic transglycosylase MltG [Brevibacterium spongiae]|uniref:Endolytic murein transglycosylase n=1 Tax=Brevibacterium spongiae TaxID=2909672 RepID=A0ABY5SK59_9MICO|nr:endolytic transglycosylase MltG [Brevibacterium spongiae]UVI34514.1 endolytic transglycosylase MltG [Brevibacterium spongiae]